MNERAIGRDFKRKKEKILKNNSSNFKVRIPQYKNQDLDNNVLEIS